MKLSRMRSQNPIKQWGIELQSCLRLQDNFNQLFINCFYAWLEFCLFWLWKPLKDFHVQIYPYNGYIWGPHVGTEFVTMPVQGKRVFRYNQDRCTRCWPFLSLTRRRWSSPILKANLYESMASWWHLLPLSRKRCSN